MTEFAIRELPAQPVLAIRCRVSLSELPTVIGQNYHSIMDYLQELGEALVFVPYTAYYNLDMADMDVAMGFPVRRLLPGRPPIEATEIPAGRFVVCQYKGPYRDMGPTYERLMAWIAEQQLTIIPLPTGMYYEYYFNGPGEVPDSELLTEIRIAVR